MPPGWRAVAAVLRLCGRSTKRAGPAVGRWSISSKRLTAGTDSECRTPNRQPPPRSEAAGPGNIDVVAIRRADAGRAELPSSSRLEAEPGLELAAAAAAAAPWSAFSGR